jgi:hypothetical protein
MGEARVGRTTGLLGGTLSLVLAVLAVLAAGPATAAPTFSPGPPPMLEPRYEPAAVALPDGRVLIAGGTKSPGVPVKTAELYDPVLNSFEKLEGAGHELAEPRAEPAYTALPGGAALIVGGYAGSEKYPLTADLFNPATNTFEPTTGNTTVPRDGAVAVLLKNGEVLVAGGFYEAGKAGIYLRSAELYDPVTRTFHALGGEMLAARYTPAAGLLPDGRVLIAGGYNPGSSPRYLASAEAFNPASGTFEALPAHMGIGRDEAGYAVLPDGKILIVGGYAGNGVAVGRSAEVFNPVTMSFEPLGAELIGERDGPAVAPLPGERFLVVGGADGGPEYPKTAEVLSFPPTATTGAASSVATTTATLNGSVVAEAASVTYFQYGATAAYGASTPHQGAGPAIPALALNAGITGLSPGASYHFRLVAEGAGVTSYGADQAFATLPVLSTTPALLAPTLSHVSQAHAVWREGSRLAHLASKRPPVGTTFAFTLDEQANVTLAFTQQLAGRRVHGRCVAPTRANRHRRSCRRTVTQAILTLAAHPGTDKVAFEGTVSAGRRLRAGTYTVVLTAANAAGQRSVPQRLTFTIVR